MLQSRALRSCSQKCGQPQHKSHISAVQRPVCYRRQALLVVAHASAAKTGLKMSGFVGEMRAIAMKLHTKEQAPKEGGTEAPKRNKPWEPSRKGYLQFLAESKVVYETFESILKQALHPEYIKFTNTGLERSAALAEDVQWLQEQYNLPAPVISQDGPGMQYAEHLKQLAEQDPQYFICHYYNYYFAHTAGGRMIGSKVADMLLDGKELKFYQYDGDVNQMLDNVRANLNDLAETWTREQKDHCLKETGDAFKWSGVVMRCMTEDDA